MSDPKPYRWLSSDYKENKEKDEVLVVHLNKNRDQEELHFIDLEDLFNYLCGLDEDTWRRMKPILKNKIHHLKGHSKLKLVHTKKMAFGISVLFLVLFIIISVLFLVILKKKPSCGDVPLPRHSPPCPPHWFWYQGKCYYFSEEEKNWTSSKDFCFSHDASLARITKEEMDFIHLLKGKDAFWIGLRRSPGQPWTWLNGDIAVLEVLGDGGDCAYLDNDFRVISARCRTTFRWMCSKPDVLKQPK